MSYARFGQDGSDVYIFMSTGGWLECCWCSLGETFEASSTAEMLAHIDEHRSVGDFVPGHVPLDLQLDDSSNFPS